MALEDAKRFLNACKTDEKIRKQLMNRRQAHSSGEQLAICARVANDLGYTVSADEIARAIEEHVQEARAKSDKVANEIGKISEKELDRAAGGFYNYPDVCSSDFIYSASTNECWFDDSCLGILNWYDIHWDCMGAHTSARCTSTVKSKAWKPAN